MSQIKLVVSILRIELQKLVGLEFPDGTSLILSVRVLSTKEQTLPLSSEIRVPLPAVSSGNVSFEEPVRLFLPIPFPKKDIVRFAICDAKDPNKVFLFQRSKALPLLGMSKDKNECFFSFTAVPPHFAVPGKSRIYFQCGPFSIPSLDGVSVSSEKFIIDSLRRLADRNKEIDPEVYADIYDIRELMGNYLGISTSKDTKPKAGKVGKGRFKSTLLSSVMGDSRTPDWSFGSSQGSVTFPDQVEEIKWSEMPISVDNPELLSFGCGDDVAPIDTGLREVIKIENRTNKKIYVEIADITPNPPRYVCNSDKKSFHLDPLGSSVINLSLRLLCTMELDLSVPVKVWDGESPVCFMASLRGKVYGEPSTKLDPDELEMGDELGNGTFGIVYKSRYRGVEVAMKVLKSSTPEPDPETMMAFEREVFNLEKLRHPAIVHFFGSVQQKGMLAIVTELCRFGSLDKVLQNRPQLGVMFRLKALLDTANAMDYLHNNHFIHRDLKPQNVLVCSLQPGKHPTSMAPIVKLSDFGTTRGLGALALSRKQMLMSTDLGTPLYKAPEVLAHSRYYDTSVDVYSFGIMIPNVMTGLFPYLQPTRKFTSPSEFESSVIAGTLRPDVPENVPQALKELMTHCWDGKPDQRPPFCEIVTIIQKVIDESAPH